MNANNILSNSVKEIDHNDDVDRSYFNLYLCNASTPYKHSLSFASELLQCSTADLRWQTEQLPKCLLSETPAHAMGKYDKHSIESFYRVLHILCTISVTLLATTLSRAIFYCFVTDSKAGRTKIWLRYVIEYFVIMVPVIVSVNVANQYVEPLLLFAFLAFIFIIWRTKCWQLVAKRDFEFGRRPPLFTLMRSSINIITAVCILAIDFKSFPKEFRKTRRYGVGLMDVGIGMFVFSMGLVAPRPTKLSDSRKLAITVVCLLALGIARTLVITAIDYHQDEHEYGAHLNAFFTLGLTKLFASLFGFLTRNNIHLLLIGLVILVIHETILQCGASQYVMDPEVERSNFLSANREGIYSLPGFVSLYLLSQYLGKWLQAKDVLNFEEMKNKLRSLAAASSFLWLLATLAIFVVGIARVTCNSGYILWILATAVIILALYCFVFDIILDTLMPANIEANKMNLSELTANSSISSVNSKLPLIVEAVNLNGLTFFLLANILTGCTNMFFDTDEKSNLQSVFILFVYMLITTTAIFILYRFRIRIA